ncbi:putative membrane protein YhiD involved in acid resistance [Rossellomorea marisflavi]
MNEQINFSDIFKSSFIEKTTSFSLTDSIIGLVVAFLIGLFIYVVYKKTFNGVIYSHSFNISLLIMTMATALVIMGISNNVLLSLGMVGALSIVRFRTPIKDPMDLVYIFWSIVSGILCGAGFIPLVVIGSVLIGIVLLVFVNKMTVENPFLLIVKAGSGSSSEAIEAELKKLTSRYQLKSQSFMGSDEMETTYEVRMKTGESAMLAELKALPGIKSAVMVSYDGNFTA